MKIRRQKICRTILGLLAELENYPPVDIHQIAANYEVRIYKAELTNYLWGFRKRTSKDVFICVNDKLSEVDARWVVARELGRHFLHSGCPLGVTVAREGKMTAQDVEVNIFALQTLMPDDVIHEFLLGTNPNLDSLATTFQVNRRLFEIRMMGIGYIVPFTCNGDKREELK